MNIKKLFAAISAAAVISAVTFTHVSAYETEFAGSIDVPAVQSEEYMPLKYNASGNLEYRLMTIDGRECSTVNKASVGTVLIFGRDTCYNTKSTLRSIADSDWIDDGTIDVYFIDESTDASQTAAFKDAIDGERTDLINFCYDAYNNSSSMIYQYRSKFGTSDVSYDTLPIVVVINSNNDVVKVTKGPINESYIYGLLSNPDLASEFFGIKVSGTLSYDDANNELELVNQVRAEVGASPVVLDAELTEAAMKRAAELAVVFSHTRPDNTSCFTVSSKAGGENIAIGQSDVNAVMNSWVNSSGHYSNMINSRWTISGLGCFTDSYGQKYWVQLFGNSTLSPYSKSGSKDASYTVFTSPQTIKFRAYDEKNTVNGVAEYTVKAYHVNPGFSYYKLPFSPSELEYTCLDPELAGIDADGRLYPTKSGECRVKVSLKAADCFSSTATFTFPDKKSANVSYFVERLYSKMLDRYSESAGKADWVNALLDGKTAAEVSSGFVLSEELAKKNLSSTEFVTKMYRTFMNREPDPAGLADWVSSLDNGCSYAYVLNNFVMSKEFGEICSDYGINTGSYELTEPRDMSRALTAFTSRMYTKALGRKYEVEGLNDWTGSYIRGENTLKDMAYGFIFSKEFIEKNLSNEEYVDTLYATFFDREADAAGKADWLSKLNSGELSREQVLDGFLGADEFAQLVRSFGLN